MQFIENIFTMLANGFITLWLWLWHSGMIGVAILAALFLARIEIAHQTQDTAPRRLML